MVKVSVSRNIYGNYRGRVGRDVRKELGCNEFNAKEWLREQLDTVPGAVVSLSSDILASDLGQSYVEINIKNMGIK